MSDPGVQPQCWCVAHTPNRSGGWGNRPSGEQNSNHRSDSCYHDNCKKNSNIANAHEVDDASEQSFRS